MLEQYRRTNKQSAKGEYLKVPLTFVDLGFHKKTKAALRLLIFLHLKKSQSNMPVTIRNDTMEAELAVSLATLKSHKAKLVKLGLLVQMPSMAGRTRAYEYYPLFVQG